ncbi:AraC family transcriptional regulator [Paenibacillus qinlingensis]|uniref:AraC-like DNA-binding protein n=1 Tax=Paenibacillus qinlingensis TaxID=1837343 RepID=A0ABU1P751_9BACL|nr:AraC family transcriptional regulator [Paenibacillus qinlingensis]MDR6555597.1 AraC-like DNA-binding protein [Paenibacillus qinlingensis]
MQKKWFYRLLFSYVPFFFFIVLVLMMVFYYKWNVETRERIQNTNDVFASHVMNVMDSSFQTIENFVIQQMLTDEAIKGYFSSIESVSPYSAYEVSQRLNNIKTLFPFAGDVYLYKKSSNEVITDNSIFKLDQFADASFVEAAFKGEAGVQWTAPRSYNQFKGEMRSDQVLSLAKRVPITSSVPNGVVVININLGSLTSMLQSIKASAADSIELLSAQDKPFKEPGADLDFKPNAWAISTITSSYTGWKLAVKVPKLEQGSLLAVFFGAWTLPMFGAILISLMFLMFITHRNYKPIEEIMIRIDRYALKRSLSMGKKSEHDEFQFITSALDNLVEKSNQYELRHQEDLSIRKKYWFYELLEGNFSLNQAEWETEAAQLELPESFHSTLVMIIEIDNYQEFQAKYSSRDQSLFKFVIHGVLQEIAQSQELTVWFEWKEADQLCAILYVQAEQDYPSIEPLAQLIKNWVSTNLKFTISIYVGTRGNEAEEISHSYQDALKAGQFRTLRGYNNVYYATETQSHLQSDIYRQLQSVRSLVKAVRAAEAEWQRILEELFVDMRTEQLPREKVLDIIHYLFFALEKEMEDLPPELARHWVDRLNVEARTALVATDLIGDIQVGLQDLLNALVASIQEWQLANEHHNRIDEIKLYLLQNYSNPDLSLNYLSEKFDLPSRVLSKLFKAETGERFVEYLIDIRMTEAKRLLLQTTEPVQSIGEQVGYLQVISFIRTFKKAEGSTPGEYRKQHGT